MAHMKASLNGLRPTLESFEEFNMKLEDENRRLAEEEADLDDRLKALGIVVAPGPVVGLGGSISSSQNNGDGGENSLANLDQVREIHLPCLFNSIIIYIYILFVHIYMTSF